MEYLVCCLINLFLSHLLTPTTRTLPHCRQHCSIPLIIKILLMPLTEPGILLPFSLLLLFGQMGDFTMTEKTDRLPDMEGKTKSQNWTMLISCIWPSRDSEWKQTWSSTERWRLKFRFLNYWYICTNVGPESKWCYPGGVNKVKTEGAWEETTQASQSISRGKRHSKGGGEEATFRRLLGQQTNALLKKPKAKNNKEEKCFSNVRGDGWRLELLLPCLFP